MMNRLSIVSLIVTSLGLIATIYYGSYHFRQLLTDAFLPIILFAIMSLFLVSMIKLYLFTKNIEFYPDRRTFVPKIFLIENMLKYIAKNQYNLYVIGRTNISWFNKIDENRINLFNNALKKGCIIEFVIQHQNVKNSILSLKTKNKIIKDYERVINGYEELKKKIGNSGNFKLKLTNRIIENSMTKIETYNKKIVYFTYDIGQNIVSKPFILFKKDSVFEEFKNKFNEIEKEAIGFNNYKNEKDRVKNEINELVNKYDQYSSQRDNHNKKLIPQFMRHAKNIHNNDKIPPLSIQLLITNKCTTDCVMCDHNKIVSKRNELTKPELENIIYYIHDIGTKNIIISGGEPLNRSFCIDLIESSRKKFTDLNFGLLTNGVKKGQQPISINEAERLKKSCDWIQLSIDSFDPAIYQKIRRCNYDAVRESLRYLEQAEGKANLEICYTIQKENIEESIDIIKGLKHLEFNSPIRFKFAHGPEKEDKFLIDEIEKIERFHQECKKDDRFNTEYIHKMFDKEYFSADGISKGIPLLNYKNLADIKCFIFRYSCKIDAYGDLYPCCFLFDDNQDVSDIRIKHRLGELRKKGSVPIPGDGKNVLSKLLFENLKTKFYNNPKIPIEKEACLNCTRHFYQNEFLTELEKIIYNNKHLGVEFTFDNELDTKIWI